VSGTLIGSFRATGWSASGSVLAELHDVEGQPGQMVWRVPGSKRLESYLTKNYGNDFFSHPDVFGWPQLTSSSYQLRQLGHKVTALKLPPRESVPPEGAVF
jgi:hypothetical protein